MTILLILLLILFGFGLMIVRQSYLNNRIKQRLLFGFNPVEELSDANLSAGDYGLAGSARFFYYLSEYLSTKQGNILVFCLGSALAVGFSTIFDKVIENIYLTALLGGSLILLLAQFLLRLLRKRRIYQIKFELPNALELTAAIMESGMGFESALGHVVNEADIKHPLYFDLAIMVEAMQRGRRRNEALRLWAARSKDENVADVASGMIQADQTGASLGSVLIHHATKLQKENEAFLLRRAERLPIRMLIPMVLTILPPVFIVAVGPSFVRIFQIFKEIMARA